MVDFFTGGVSMPVKSKADTKKQRFQIIVPRTSLHRFDVKAASKEEACHILHRALSMDDMKSVKLAKIPVVENWNLPLTMADGWMLMAPGDRGEPTTTLYGWDGDIIVPLQPVKRTDDIAIAFRRFAHQVAKDINAMEKEAKAQKRHRRPKSAN